MDIQLLNSNKALEIRNSGIDKGVAALYWLSKIKSRPRFVLAIGDDRTDEDLFRVMPKGAFSIKVGIEPSYSKHNLARPDDVIMLLKNFIKAGS